MLNVVLRMLLGAWLLLGWSGGAGAVSGPVNDEFLPVNEAFRFSSRLEGEQLVLQWRMADGYYLYRERFRFETVGDSGLTLAAPRFERAGTFKQDPNFGQVEVYTDSITVRLPVNAPATGSHTLQVGYQGCAAAGLCYPPQRREVTFAWPGEAVGATVAAAVQAPLTDADAEGIAGLLRQGGLLLAVATFFVLGLGLTFTPCVLPMIPILSSIIVGQQRSALSSGKAFKLSLIYVLAMAVTYSMAGALVGYFGAKANLQLYLQNPWVLSGFALLFVALALSMFGLYELQLPAAWRERLDRVSQHQQGGSYLGVGVMGVLSALVVSPCVSAPLAGALVYISSTGDAFLGGSALFALSLGMGTPLLLIGLSGGALLPQAGAWMLVVKHFFGVLLLAVAIWLLERVLPGEITLALWAVLLIISAVHLGALAPAETGLRRTAKGIGLVLLVYGVLLLIGAAGGQTDPLRPVAFAYTAAGASEATRGDSLRNDDTALFRQVASREELTRALAEASADGKMALLDVYADWCISCKIMERELFSAPAVRQLRDDVLFLQLDMTANTAEDQALLAQFGLFGPPSILLFDRTGQELRQARIQGELSLDAFIRHLRRQLSEAG